MMVSKVRSALLVTCALVGAPAVAHAQDAVAQDTGTTASKAVSNDSDEIIVTARKRVETALETPVILTAIGGAEIERRAITGVDKIARAVPQVMIGEGGGTFQGGPISIRGLAASDNNALGDQAVSFNIDGVQIARATVRRISEMDLAQVEVLKGPQTLFFGKNSPAGIISIRSADPTDRFEAKASYGYEFNAHEHRGDGYVSGPLTDTLGARLAFFGSHMRGWIKDIAPRDALLASKHVWHPRATEYAVRGTLKFEPSDRFDARLKLTYNKAKGDAATATSQIIHCAAGAPEFGAVGDCKPNDITIRPVPGPVVAATNPLFGDGDEVRMRTTQFLGGLELNYKLGDHITLTSMTGYYDSGMRHIDNYSAYYDPAPSVPAAGGLWIRETTQELRLASSFDGPLNFLVGGLYQDSRASTRTTAYLNSINPVLLLDYDFVQQGKAYSAFGQLQWKIVPELELSAGGRYSHEKKNLSRLRVRGVDVEPKFSSLNWNDFSPEVTLAWRPSRRLTVFGSYKEGFLSGGFSPNAIAPGGDVSYEPQFVRGFEGGVKTALMDGRLRLNLSAFDYTVRGLQTTFTQNAVVIVTNVGKAAVTGGEFDFSFNAGGGLRLNGALAYNHGRYILFNAPCYRGQTVAMGCNQVPNAAGRFTAQDLSGTELLRAPKWTGNAGVSYESELGSELKFGASTDVNFTSSYFTNSASNPNGRQKSYGLLDASVSLGSSDDRWELSLIGTNLTNKYYYVRSGDIAGRGSNPGLLTGVLSDQLANVSRGREIMMRATVRY